MTTFDPELFHFRKGKVIRHTRAEARGAVIVIDGGVELTESISSTTRTWYDIGDEVFVSWRSTGPYPKPFFGTRYVYSSAIEPHKTWENRSAYVKRFRREQDHVGFRAEDLVINALNRHRVRAHRASGYQDELLKIDAWVFLPQSPLAGDWMWYPINITTTPLTSRRSRDEKYIPILRRGVVPVYIPRVHVRDVEGHTLKKDTLIEDFFRAFNDFFATVQPVSRVDVSIQELLVYPPARQPAFGVRT